LSSLPHQAISLPVEGIKVALSDIGEEEVVCDALVVVPVVETGVIDAVVFWFHMNMYGDLILDTGPQQKEEPHDYRQQHHYRQAAVLLTPGKKSVTAGESITLRLCVTLSRGVYILPVDGGGGKDAGSNHEDEEGEEGQGGG